MGSDDDRQFDEHGNPYITDAAGDKHFAPRASTQLIVHRGDWNLLEKIKNTAKSLIEHQENGCDGWKCRKELKAHIVELDALRSVKRALPAVQLAKYQHEVEEPPNGSQ